MSITPLLKPSQIKRKNPDIIDGILYETSKATNEPVEFCVSKAAIERRRREIYERDGRCCVKCGRPLRWEAGFEDSMHWSHKRHRSLGGDDSMKNGETLCKKDHLEGEHGQF